jgi:thermitase
MFFSVFLLLSMSVVAVAAEEIVVIRRPETRAETRAAVADIPGALRINAIPAGPAPIRPQGIHAQIQVLDNVSLEAIQKDPDVIAAGYNHRYEIFAVPNDPSISQQYMLNATSVFRAWDLTSGSRNITIAIIDTGMEWDHSDLAAHIWNNTDEDCDDTTDLDNNGFYGDCRGYDFVNVTSGCSDDDCQSWDNAPMDDHGHGTHVGGIAAAVFNNSEGIAGICGGCSLMPVRAGYKGTDNNGYLATADIVQAIYYATDNGADVISMSFGLGLPSSPIKTALDYAEDAGVLLVAAAGNSEASFEIYPAAYDNVIAVAATDSDGEKASFSQYGDWVDLSAPGVLIYSTYLGDTYASFSGTSMATPIVAGALGLYLSAYGDTLNMTTAPLRLNSTGDDPISSSIGNRLNITRFLTKNTIVGSSENCTPPLGGTWSITDTVVCNGGTMTINDNITISGNGSMTFLHGTATVTGSITASDLSSMTFVNATIDAALLLYDNATLSINQSDMNASVSAHNQTIVEGYETAFETLLLHENVRTTIVNGSIAILDLVYQNTSVQKNVTGIHPKINASLSLPSPDMTVADTTIQGLHLHAGPASLLSLFNSTFNLSVISGAHVNLSETNITNSLVVMASAGQEVQTRIDDSYIGGTLSISGERSSHIISGSTFASNVTLSENASVHFINSTFSSWLILQGNASANMTNVTLTKAHVFRGANATVTYDSPQMTIVSPAQGSTQNLSKRAISLNASFSKRLRSLTYTTADVFFNLTNNLSGRHLLQTIPLVSYGNVTLNFTLTDMIGTTNNVTLTFIARLSLNGSVNDTDGDGVDDVNDSILGTSQNVYSSYTNLSVSVNSSEQLNRSYVGVQEVRFTHSGRLLLAFPHNFTGSILNLTSLVIQHEATANRSRLLVNGAMMTKTLLLRLEGNYTRYGSLCIKDMLVYDFSSLSANCTGTNETYIRTIPANISGYTITYEDNQTIRIAGLNHSAVSQECSESWSCGSWSSCSAGTQTRTCTDANSCGTTHDQPERSRSCDSGGGGGGGGGSSSSGGGSAGGAGYQSLDLDSGTVPVMFRRYYNATLMGEDVVFIFYNRDGNISVRVPSLNDAEYPLEGPFIDIPELSWRLVLNKISRTGADVKAEKVLAEPKIVEDLPEEPDVIPVLVSPPVETNVTNEEDSVPSLKTGLLVVIGLTAFLAVLLVILGYRHKKKKMYGFWEY